VLVGGHARLTRLEFGARFGQCHFIAPPLGFSILLLFDGVIPSFVCGRPFRVLSNYIRFGGHCKKNRAAEQRGA
jgi:hypothetical protein